MSPRPAIEHIRKPQILEAAAQVITERGLGGTRIADVAKRAGTSAPAVLYWFESREELLNEALIADEEAFADRIAGVLAGGGSAAMKLRRVIEATVGDSDISLWVELWARSLHDPAAAAARLRLDGEWRGMLADLIASGQVTGEFDPEIDPAWVALSLGSLMDGLGVQMTLRDPAATTDVMLAIVIGHAESLLGVKLERADSEATEVVLA